MATEATQAVYLQSFICSHPGCEQTADCIIDNNGTSRYYCADHIPSDAPLQCLPPEKCAHDGCIFRATEAVPRSSLALALNRPTHCYLHSDERFVHVSATCLFPGCRELPCFGTMKHPQACKFHVISSMHAIGGQCPCGKGATHNIPDATGGGCFCSTCAREIADDLINVRARNCAHPGCHKKPTYTPPGSTRKTYCAEHAPLYGAKLDASRLCMHPGCQISGTYSFTDDTGARKQYCAKHCKQYMPTHEAKSNVRICEYISPDGVRCTTCASCANPGEKIKRFCAKHAPVGMQLVGFRRCACGRLPTFNFVGQPAMFCAQCRQEGMINVLDKLCEYVDPDGTRCAKRARFGNAGERQRFCKTHREEQMINVCAHYCDHIGCKTIATYGFARGAGPLQEEAASAPIDYQARYCVKHKLPGMVDVKHRTCSCGNRATYHDPDETVPKYCLACAPVSAVNDNPKCCVAGCKMRASFGPLFSRAIHCASHAHEIVDGQTYQYEFDNRYPTCAISGCRARPLYCADETDATNYPTHCARHAPDDAHRINPVPSRCIRCQKMRVLCDNPGSPIHQLCASCAFAAPDKVYIRHHKYQETVMRDFLESEHLTPTMYNQCIRSSIGAELRFRPDFYYDRQDDSATDHYKRIAIIIEVDEHQHGGAIYTVDMTSYQIPLIEVPKSDSDRARYDPREIDVIKRPGYTRDGELARMIIIQRALDVPTLFIRFNPDEYYDDTRHRHNPSRGTIRAKNILPILRLSNDRLAQLLPHDVAVIFAYFDGQRPDHLDHYDIDVIGERINHADITAQILAPH